jgi:outer membrane protein OmpA-like peptidoglycan-associated protein
MNRLLSISGLFLLTTMVMAQSGFDYTSGHHLPKSDPLTLSGRGAFALSNQKFRDKYGETPGTAQAMLQMGDNYRMNGQPVEAALWYSRGIEQARTPEDHLHLARMLKMIGQCEEANARFRIYLNITGRKAADLCTHQEASALQNLVVFEHLPYINSSGSDFAAAPWGDRLLFTSDRTFTRPGSIQDPWTMRNFTSLFYSERDKSGKWRSVKRLRSMDSRYHDGAAIPDPSGLNLYFSRSHAQGLNANNMRDLGIVRARRQGSGWEDAGPLPFNDPAYAVCHPAISADGKVMVFASDKPGGLGGMDLYRVNRQGDTWGEPVNLGPGINTADNEVFPAISTDGFLFYASDGQSGFGGLDVYAGVPEEDGHWLTGRNLGSEVNSTYDDFALQPLPGRRGGYISTNRPGGHGLDDIYFWTSEKPLGDLMMYSAEILVVDTESGAPVPFAQIRFGKNVLQTNEAGRVKLRTPISGVQRVQAEADGYLPGDEAIEFPYGNAQVIRLSPAAYQPFLFSARDQASRSPLPTARFEVFEFLPGGQLIPVDREAALSQLDQLKKQVPAEGATDEITGPSLTAGFPKDELPWVLDARKRYQIKATAEGYQTAFLDLVAPEITGKGPLTRKVIDMEPLILGIKEEDLTEGATFRLDGIYYDYNKADIRADARGNLDELARLMKKYPNMMIELSSHTDSRGNDFYNLDLSQRRADAAIAYLNSLGIATEKLVARGYGERKPVNHCRDGVKCSDEEHQLNRRTEFRIIRM